MGFEILVDNIIRMDFFQNLEEFFGQNVNLGNGIIPIFLIIKRIFIQLHLQEIAVFPFSSAFDFGDALFVSDSLEDVDFVEEGASFALLDVDVLDFEGGEFLSLFVFDFVDFSEAAFADFAEEFVPVVEDVVVFDELFQIFFRTLHKEKKNQ